MITLCIRRYFPTLLVLFAATMFVHVDARAQVIDNADRHDIGFGARATGLADACATEYQDVSGMYWNPATLAFLQSQAVMADILRQSDGRLSSEAVAFPVRLATFSSLGVGLMADQLVLDDSLGNPVSGHQYGLDIGSAVALAYTFSLGVRMRAEYAETSSSRTWAVAGAIGLLYAPSNDISYALVYTGLGTQVSYNPDFTSPSSITFGTPRLPRMLHMGITMRFPSSEVDRILTLALANEKVFGVSGITYKVGLEINTTSWLDLRTGLLITPAGTGVRYGLGAKFAGAAIDYAYAPGILTAGFHELTFSVAFDNGSPDSEE